MPQFVLLMFFYILNVSFGVVIVYFLSYFLLFKFKIASGGKVTGVLFCYYYFKKIVALGSIYLSGRNFHAYKFSHVFENFADFAKINAG